MTKATRLQLGLFVVWVLILVGLETFWPQVAQPVMRWLWWALLIYAAYFVVRAGIFLFRTFVIKH